MTPEEKARRAGMMTGSRIAPLMTGDTDKILRLYREFLGEIEEENLDDVWPVQLGVCTEKLNLGWYEKKNKVLLTKRNTLVIFKDNEMFGATLDAWDPNLKCPVECKHVGGHEPSEIIIDRYQPQMQWQMLCTGATQCALSVIKGAAEPVVDYVPRHEPYINEMLERAYSFLLCVAMRTPPVDIKPAPEVIVPYAKVDMNGNNLWGHAAGMWLEYRPAHQKFEDARDVLKSLVPPEAKIAFGCGVAAARARNGAITIRKEKSDAQD